MQDERCIIVPTWRGHFNQAIVLEESYIKNTDKSARLVFVCSDKEETEELRKILSGNENVYFTDLEYLIKKVDGVDVKPYPQCAKISGKHPYQGIKKAYALTGIEYSQALLMDCEAKFLKSCLLDDLFDEYFNQKTIWYSNLVPNLRSVNEAALISLPKEFRNNLTANAWLFEYQGWFFEKQLWLDAVNEIKKSHSTILKNFMSPPREVFEIVAYYQFLHSRCSEYRFLNIEEEIKKFFTKEKAESFLGKFNNRHCGILEFFFRGSSPDNVNDMIKFINHHKIRFARIEPVEPSGYSSTGDYALAWKIFNESNLCVLTCSEAVCLKEN